MEVDAPGACTLVNNILRLLLIRYRLQKAYEGQRSVEGYKSGERSFVDD